MQENPIVKNNYRDTTSIKNQYTTNSSDDDYDGVEESYSESEIGNAPNVPEDPDSKIAPSDIIETESGGTPGDTSDGGILKFLLPPLKAVVKNNKWKKSR